jgi:hypothetical protein
LLFVFLATETALSCNRDTASPTTHASATQALAAGIPSVATNSSASETFRPAAKRIIAIGDLHGDLRAAIDSFRLAALLDDTEKWIGGSTVVVQTGDVLDRGDTERPLLDWFDKIAAQAVAAGGAVYRLNGNHEVMNVAGDLRYVSAAGFTAFNDALSGPHPDSVEAMPERARGRLLSFLPGRPWAKKLSVLPVVLVVGDNVFAHGGLRPAHVDYGIARINAEVSAWMRGDAALPRSLESDESPYWLRDYGDDVTVEECAALELVLTRLKAARLVIGHTPQKGGITFACAGKVARIDVGLSSDYGGRAATVLEIQDGKVGVLDAAKR